MNRLDAFKGPLHYGGSFNLNSQRPILGAVLTTDTDSLDHIPKKVISTMSDDRKGRKKKVLLMVRFTKLYAADEC